MKKYFALQSSCSFERGNHNEKVFPCCKWWRFRSSPGTGRYDYCGKDETCTEESAYQSWRHSEIQDDPEEELRHRNAVSDDSSRMVVEMGSYSPKQEWIFYNLSS